MRAPLFIYGTLRHEVVRDAVFQRQTTHDDFTFYQACLAGYAVYHVDGTAYPMITQRADGQAVGLCWYGLTDADLEILDRFEGKNYSRVPVQIMRIDNKQIVMAEVYQPMTALKPGAIWDFDSWSRTGLEVFLGQDFNLAGVRGPGEAPC